MEVQRATSKVPLRPLQAVERFLDLRELWPACEWPVSVALEIVLGYCVSH